MQIPCRPGGRPGRSGSWPASPGSGWSRARAPARVTAVEDFYRKRFIYQLTRAGEAA
ncbi:hypothetical protein ABZY09_26630 [Streptomyces sp. NPDC002928]|uniref:hypothetical protein n=1 Tax=Streptomyces sp. NPDC002928 TaxID=3154440 RepID=UPI0033B72EF4